MAEPICLNCKHFDHTDTSLPICTLHRKYSESGWACGKYEAKEEKK